MDLKKLLGILTLTLTMAASSAIAAAQDATTGVTGEAISHECVTDLGTSEAPDNAIGYVLNSEDSLAEFVATEELAGAGVKEAVGTTNAVIGTILIGEDGTPLQCSRIDVDLRMLVTDESRRDGQIQQAMETEQFPLATFIITEIEGVDGPLEDGVETELVLIGNLSIHGIEKQVAWDATVTLADGSVTGTATTQVIFSDFEIEKPVIGPVMSIEDEVGLTIHIVATPAD